MTNQIKLLSIVLLGMFALVGCTQEEDPVVEDPKSAYMGTWEGTFSGDDSGTWTMLVDQEGAFSGTVYASGGQNPYPLTGTVDDTGAMEAYIDINGSILDFDGQVAPDKVTASGTWGNPALKLTGTWEGSKQ